MRKPKYIGIDRASRDGDYTAYVYGNWRVGKLTITKIRYKKRPLTKRPAKGAGK